MGSTTGLNLDERLHQSIGDWIEEDTTTNLASGSTFIISTNLNKWDAGEDNYFNNYWAYITASTSLGEDRQVSDYASSSGQLTIRGAGWAGAESAAIAFRLYQYSWTETQRAMNDAIREIYPALHRRYDNRILITGNVLPNAHFEDQSTSGTPDEYSYTNASGAEVTAAGSTRGGSSALKITASTANGYLYINSDTYPELLDMVGRGANFYCWAYPEEADDAALEIYTIDAAGSTQTLTSDTAAPSLKWTLLTLKEQSINDNITSIEYRFKVATKDKYVIFDDALATGFPRREFLLPTDFQTNHLSQVYVQTGGGYHSEAAAYDAKPRYWQKEQFRLIKAGTASYLQLRDFQTDGNRIRLIGHGPLETIASQTTSISIDGERVNMLLALSAKKLYDRQMGTAGSEDIGRFERESIRWEREYRLLKPQFMMVVPSDTMYSSAGW